MNLEVFVPRAAGCEATGTIHFAPHAVTDSMELIRSGLGKAAFLRSP